jgi:small-conductance mechanosensitive channel
METLLQNLFYDPFVGKIIAAALGIIIINMLVRFLQRTLVARIKEKNARYGLRRGLAFFGYLAAALLLAAIFSDQLSSLTVALGIAGAGIAFALQEVIASVAGWIALSFGQFYTVGDRVQLGGIKGDVIDIGVLRTTLMEIGEWVKGDQYNGRIVRVANSFVFKEPVYNYSADFPFVWDEITVPIKYGSDHTLARKIIQDAAQKVVSEYVAFAHQTWQNILRKYAIEDASVEPIVTLVANDNWMEFTLRYVVDFKKRRSTKDLLFTRILDGVAASDGRVSMASATFHLVEAPVFDVRLHTSEK